jgi:hypothetical protein
VPSRPSRAMEPGRPRAEREKRGRWRETGEGGEGSEGPCAACSTTPAASPRALTQVRARALERTGSAAAAASRRCTVGLRTAIGNHRIDITAP